MQPDTRRDDLRLLLLAVLATGCFAFDAAGHNGGIAFLAGVLASFLLQRYQYRERKRLDRPAWRDGGPMPSWIAAIFGIALIASLGYAKWTMPRLPVTAICAVCSALEMPAPLRRLAARRTRRLPAAF